MPIAVPVVLAAAKSQAVQRVGEGLAGLVGDTAKDRTRKARAEQLTAAALSGDAAALRQLAYDAFEPANGLPGDNRAVDFGTRSPPLSRDLARKGLQDYVRKFGGLPPTLAQYADRLGARVVTTEPLLAEILRPAVNTITDTALERAAERTQETAKQYMPLVIGGVVLVAVIAFAMLRKRT